EIPCPPLDLFHKQSFRCRRQARLEFQITRQPFSRLRQEELRQLPGIRMLKTQIATQLGCRAPERIQRPFELQDSLRDFQTTLVRQLLCVSCESDREVADLALQSLMRDQFFQRGQRE